MASTDVQEDLKCSICLNIYADPVTLTCGHNFCQECIRKDLNTKQKNGEDYSCPQCRKRFRGRPVLQKNTNLSNIAEKVKYSAGLQNTKCSEHNRILEFYCIEHSTIICVLCRLDEKHQGHEVETLEVASEKKKNKLRNYLEILIAEREKTEKRVQDLQQHRRMAEEHADELMKKVTAMFMDIRKRVDDLENRVQREISRQAKQKSISSLIRELEVQKEELSRKIGHMEKLNKADPMTLLQVREPYRHTKAGKWLPQNETGGLDEFVISIMLQDGLSDIERMRNTLFPVLPQHANITLDINTEADYVEISDDRKSAQVKEEQWNPAKKNKDSVVLSTRGFSSGKHYWMVEGSTTGEWAIGMCYPSMNDEWGCIGENSKSWAIRVTKRSLINIYLIRHNGKIREKNPTVSSKSLLVYLDYEAGRLSFYELSDPLRLLYTFTTTFTEPLHAAFHFPFLSALPSQITVL